VHRGAALAFMFVGGGREGKRGMKRDEREEKQEKRGVKRDEQRKEHRKTRGRGATEAKERKLRGVFWGKRRGCPSQNHASKVVFKSGGENERGQGSRGKA